MAAADNVAEKAPYSGRNMVLTDEERAVMKECERESFYKRALPLSFGAMLATSMMVKSGKWTGHPKYGALPKTALFGGIGYITGKIMYLPICQEKILQTIPNSSLAASVRKARGIQDSEEHTNPSSASDFPSVESSKLRDEYSALDSSPSPSGPPAAGLDDRFRPSVDKDVKPREDSTEDSSKPKTSYEELRRRNRQQYEESQAKKPSSPPPKNNPFLPQKVWPEDGEGEDKQAPPPPPPRDPQRKKRTNIWGDVIED